ncbi:MAG: phosphate acyltransferase PlsX [Dichotomicrobium sp.]
MTDAITIAVDAMGGDHGPAISVAGTALSAVRHPDARFLLFGDEEQIKPLVEAHPELADKVEIFHTDIAVAMDARPSQALKQGRWKSSIWLALEAVKRGDADVVISAGNTGALMAMAKFCLRTVPGIDRPAIAALWPTVDSECIVLDVGANVGADARQLVNFAEMGAAMARALFQVEKPSVALLNVGVEEIKGLDEVKKANAALASSTLPVTYYGYVEGNDVGQGVVDVVVTEGFTGNIALKTAEGTARQIAEYFRAAVNRSLLSRVGAFLAQGAFRALRKKMDPRQMNGGVFLGLNGVVIKSHGGTDAVGFASAVDLGYDMARSKLCDSIARDVSKFQAALSEKAADQEADTEPEAHERNTVEQGSN